MEELADPLLINAYYEALKYNADVKFREILKTELLERIKKAENSELLHYASYVAEGDPEFHEILKTELAERFGEDERHSTWWLGDDKEL